jgi:hypothetical protein
MLARSREPRGAHAPAPSSKQLLLPQRSAGSPRVPCAGTSVAHEVERPATMNRNPDKEPTMMLRNPSIFAVLSLVSSLTVGCVELDDAGGLDDPDQLGEPGDPEESTTSSELFTQVLGGVDLDAGCKIKHGPWAYATLLGSPYSTWAVTNWRCQSGGSQHGIDVTQFCRLQYLLPTASARYTDPNNAYSWQCVISF